MPRTETRKLYQYGELSDEAKKKAVDWYRGREWAVSSELITDSFKYELERLGYPTDDVEWSLSYSQGDGVAFYGSVGLYDWLKAKQRLTKYLALLKKDPGSGVRRLEYLSAEIRRNSWGAHYSHWNTMVVDLTDDGGDWTPKQAHLIELLEHELAEDVKAVSKRLERQGYLDIEHQLSEEYISEVFEANEYEFLESGLVP